MDLNLGVILAIAGLVVALGGAYLASTLPLIPMLETARSYMGGEDEKWIQFRSEVTWKTYAANTLLVVGTALQIWGAVISQSPSDKTTAVSVAPPAPEAR